jgi:7-cyano-7-deazaguanine synthase
MAQRDHVMVLHSGGLRSLVALALTLHRGAPTRVTLVHLADGRPTAAIRREHLDRQADHYALRQVHELPAGDLYSAATAQQPDGRPRATLAAPRMLLQALAHAVDHRADELCWPVAVDADPAATATAQEQQIVAEQLRSLEPADVPDPAARFRGLTVPLLGYDDRQLVELGHGLKVPWDLAWSCLLPGPAPCGSCPACRRRRAAFRAAGVIDPAVAPPRRAAGVSI